MNKKYLVPFLLVTSLFFLWAFLHNVNAILIPHLKKVCQLSDMQSAFIDTAVALGYFVMALPAGWFMHRFGYKNGILFGLLLYGAGAALFIPAASSRTYDLFLLALFIIASGATFLETVANPYVTKLGDPATATFRLNLAQTFNGVGAFLAPIIGGKVILSGIEHSKEQLAKMSVTDVQAYLNAEASAVKIPYMVIALAVAALIILFLFTKLPDIREQQETSSGFSFSVLRHKHLSGAVLAQFFYVGAQTCVFSFSVRYAKSVAGMDEHTAAYLWGWIAMVGFMVGRLLGTLLMRVVKPSMLMFFYALIAIGCLGLSMILPGHYAFYAVMAVPFFMSIMYPTIFSIGIAGLGEETKIAASFIVMAIVGGAIFPPVMGFISDRLGGNLQLAFIVPTLCFFVIAWFAWRFRNTLSDAPVAGHA